MAKSAPKSPRDPFDNVKFDTISNEIKSKNTMEEIRKVIEEKREDIFNILSTGRADWNTNKDETSLKKMSETLKKKKEALEKDLWKAAVDFDISWDKDNTDLITYCKTILNKDGTWKENPKLAWECRDLLSELQYVYKIWTKKEKLFKGKKNEADKEYAELTEPDTFSDIINATKDTELENSINEFVKKTFSPKDNTFWIAKSMLYTEPTEQAKVAARIAIFLHCMSKALEKWKIPDTTKVETIINNLRDNQIPKIKWLYNLKKAKGAVDAEYETLIDIRKNGITDISWTDTTKSIDLTDSFESKSTHKAKKIDSYNLNKDDVEITIDGTTHTKNDIILKDPSWDKQWIKTEEGNKSGGFDIYVKVPGKDVKVWEISIDYETVSKKASFVFKKNPLIFNELGTTSDIDIKIPIMAIKKVIPKTNTWEVSLTKSIVTKLKSWASEIKESQREWAMTISNVEQVNRAIAEREADEELREKYRNIGRKFWQRADLFLRRKFIKDKIVKKKMAWKKWFDWDDSSQAAAHRHQIEEQEKLSDNLNTIVDIDATNYPETRLRLDALINDFTWKSPTRKWIDEDDFKIQFEYILSRSGTDFDTGAPKKINEIITSGSLRSLSTNIIMQAKQFQAHQKMVYDIWDHITINSSETEDAFDTWCRKKIENYIDTYDDIPDFLKQIGISLDDKDAIKTLKANDSALSIIQAQTLKYKLQILDGGDEAYNVKKWDLDFFTKAWRLLDDPVENVKWFEEHPNAKKAFGVVRWGAKLAAIPLALFALWPWPLATAWIISGVSGVTTFLKKKSHYEKENRSYQRMQATNLTDYRNKRMNLANEVAWMKRHQGRFWWKKKRVREQYRDYVLATQDQLELTSDLIAKIKAPFKKWGPLSPAEKSSLQHLLADWLARLDFHKETGQNFLWSDNPALAEKEYKQLQNAIIWWTLRLNIDLKDLRSKSPYNAYYNNTKKIIKDWTGDTYDKQWYDSARKRFKKRSNLKAIDSALFASWLSFGLSYLLSSLASHNKVAQHDTLTNKSSWNVWWEFNPWDIDESLLIPWSWPTWSINPEMSAYINSSTHEITWATLYSSVDAAPCSEAFWLAQETAAMTHLSSTYSTYGISPTSDLAKAVNNYISDATNSIMAIPWLDAWNQHLAIARAVEAVNAWIVQPAGSAWIWNSINIGSTALSRWNWWIQASWVWTVAQWFRNMGIIWLDYVEKWTEQIVEHVNKAIAIPVWLNTFWSPRSDAS